MTIKMVAMVLNCPVLRPRERRILEVIADHADKMGRAFVGHKRLAWRAMCDTRTSKRAVKALEAMGVLKVLHGGGTDTNTYLINLIWLTRLDRLFDDLEANEREQGRDPFEAMQVKAEEIADRLHVDGVPMECVPGSWGRAVDVVTLRKVFGTTPKPEETPEGGDTQTPPNGEDQPVENAETGSEGGDKSDAGGDRIAAGGDISCHPNPEPLEPKRAREADPPSTDPPPDPAGPGKLDDERGLVVALERATVWWVATGQWPGEDPPCALPPGRTLPIGPPPYDPGFALKPGLLDFLLHGEIRPSVHLEPSRHGDRALRALGLQIRQAMLGDHPERRPDEIRARLAALEQVVAARDGPAGDRPERASDAAA